MIIISIKGVITVGTKYLGTYLRDVRLGRKKDNIQEYLNEYNVHAITESYYRAIESGKKYIKMDTALELCRELDVDENSFFYCLLKDALEPSVFNTLIKPRIIDNNAERRFDQLDKKLTMYENAFRKNFVREQFYGTDRMVEFLYENIEFLPIIHFVYMREQVSFKDIEIIIAKNDMKYTIDEVISIIKEYDLAEVDEVLQTITKYGQDFSTPRSTAGDELKNEFLRIETEKTIQLKAHHQNQITISDSDSYVFCGIKCINFNSNHREFEKYITDLLACFHSAVEPLEDEDSVPFFFSVIVSPRQEYDSKMSENP